MQYVNDSSLLNHWYGSAYSPHFGWLGMFNVFTQRQRQGILSSAQVFLRHVFSSSPKKDSEGESDSAEGLRNNWTQ